MSAESLPASVAATIPNSSLQKPDRIAGQFIGELLDESSICSWCFDQRRIPYDDYDQARVNAKDMRANSASINSWSLDFQRNDDGTLQVISATSGPAPHTYRDVVEGRPKLWRDERPHERWEVPFGYSHNPRPREAPRPKTICGDCARIDIDPTDDRSEREIVRALRNVLERADDAGLSVDHDHAIGMVHNLRNHDSTSGKDRWVLERSLAYGIEIFRKRQRQRRRSDDSAEMEESGL